MIVSHGGAIRAAVAYALDVHPDNALHLSIHNLSLTRLERHPEGWRVTASTSCRGIDRSGQPNVTRHVEERLATLGPRGSGRLPVFRSLLIHRIDQCVHAVVVPRQI